MDYMNQGWGNPWQRQGSGSSYYGATNNGTSRSPWSLFDAGTTDILRSGYMTGFNGGLFDPMQSMYQQQMQQQQLYQQQMQQFMQQNTMPNGVTNFQNGYYGVPDLWPNDGIDNAGLIDTTGSIWQSDNPNNPYHGFDMNAMNDYRSEVQSRKAANNAIVTNLYNSAGLDATQNGAFNVFANMLYDGKSLQDVTNLFNHWQNTGSMVMPSTTSPAPSYSAPSAPSYSAPATSTASSPYSWFSGITGHAPEPEAVSWLNDMATWGMSEAEMRNAVANVHYGR